MKGLERTLLPAALMLGTFATAGGQNPAPGLPPLNASGQVLLDGQAHPYLIRHLPVSSFPDLPAGIHGELERRGCLIPQTFEAHRPENVISASLERKGSSDWAVLCSVNGTASLLVFFGDRDAEEPVVLASAPETERLQPLNGSKGLGFGWAIDRAAPWQVHDAQAGLYPRPAMVDHDALADSTVERRTIYHFYANGAWRVLETPVH